ncbi:hypothetical protein [Halosegnis marinus]|uniref:Uncharacterized protein n=1 Tax=Halosegnis marinus TaxID=3034023 RepID=A0ABD5ZM99_9EURY|nr:hypothetical protein [Halosegnis sp. DT85]
MLGCDTPGQSLVVMLVAGLLAGGAGLAAGLGPVAVALLAGALALVGEVGAHVVRGDPQWRAAVASLR